MSTLFFRDHRYHMIPADDNPPLRVTDAGAAEDLDDDTGVAHNKQGGIRQRLSRQTCVPAQV